MPRTNLEARGELCLISDSPSSTSHHKHTTRKKQPEAASVTDTLEKFAFISKTSLPLLGREGGCIAGRSSSRGRNGNT